MDQEDLIKYVDLFFEIASLRYLPRSHRHVLLTHDNTDTIAAHTGRVTLFGYFLAKALGADAGKVILMCSLHDITETRSGDPHWVHKKYITIDEEKILEDQFSGLPCADDVLYIMREFKNRSSLEAKIAKDADYLDQVFILCEYAHQGNTEARLWLEDNRQINLMSTDLAKELARQAHKRLPSDWWQNAFSPKFEDKQ